MGGKDTKPLFTATDQDHSPRFPSCKKLERKKDFFLVARVNEPSFFAGNREFARAKIFDPVPDIVVVVTRPMSRR